MKNSSNTGNVLMSCQPHEEKKKGKEKAKAGPELENFNTDGGWRVWGGCQLLSHDCFVLAGKLSGLVPPAVCEMTAGMAITLDQERKHDGL